MYISWENQSGIHVSRRVKSGNGLANRTVHYEEDDLPTRKVCLSDIIEGEDLRKMLKAMTEDMRSIHGSAARSDPLLAVEVCNNFKFRCCTIKSRPAQKIFGSVKDCLVIGIFSDTVMSNRRGSLSPIGIQPLGVIFLYDKEGQQPVSQDDTDAIERLPLTSVVSSAMEMPFRLHRRSGALSILLAKIRIDQWKAKQWLLKNLVDVLKIGIMMLAILFVLIPTFLFLCYLVPIVGEAAADLLPHGNGTPGSFVPKNLDSLAVNMLKAVEILVMVFTFIVFSLAMVSLFDPRHARGLPEWIERFTDISALKSTILTLVVILVAITFLAKYLQFLGQMEELKLNAASDLLYFFGFAASPFLIIIALAIFVKLNLPENRVEK